MGKNCPSAVHPQGSKRPG